MIPDPASRATDIVLGTRAFEDGVLVDVLNALRGAVPGQLVVVRTRREDVADGLVLWTKLTDNAVVARDADGAELRLVIRSGKASGHGDAVGIGTRLWLYTNFDCNLACDYCCVRSSPRALRRALGLDLIRRIAAEARAERVQELFVTGGEPFLMDDIADSLAACAEVAPTTVLTNGMLFRGRRREALQATPRSVTLQVSVDSPTPTLHDLHRGRGSWVKAREGITIARELGFRVRVAATVASRADEDALRAWLDADCVRAEDRVVRPVALRGIATEGVALARSDLVPEPTITHDGVYWHPVGATDDDFLVTREILPLAAAFDAVRAAYAHEREVATEMASVFYCA